MARSYSMDLRDRAVGAVESEGLSCRAAARFGVAVSNWMRRVRETGSAPWPDGRSQAEEDCRTYLGEWTALMDLGWRTEMFDNPAPAARRIEVGGSPRSRLMVRQFSIQPDQITAD